MTSVRSYSRNNYMGMSHTAREREIAEALGVTDAGLKTLLRISRGDPITGGTAGDKLCDLCLLVEPLRPNYQRTLTPAGAALLKRAIEMGY